MKARLISVLLETESKYKSRDQESEWSRFKMYLEHCEVKFSKKFLKQFSQTDGDCRLNSENSRQ